MTGSPGRRGFDDAPGFDRGRAELLARLLAGAAAGEARALLERLGVLGDASPVRRPEAPGAGRARAAALGDRPQSVAIWEPRRIGGEWWLERPRGTPLGDHHAACRRFRLRKAPGTRRVLYFGESAAAGYLYAPRVTPARLLERRLARAGDFEVIDLARVNETMLSMATTMRDALALEADVWAVFAGNNWALADVEMLPVFVPSEIGRRRVARCLREGGFPELVRVALDDLRAVVEAGVGAVARLAERGGARVVWVVPEVNLEGWEIRQPPPWLPGGGVARWYELYDRATAALHEGNGGAAERLAAEMTELDGGVCPTSWILLGRAARLAGDADRAASALRASLDRQHRSTLCFLGAPQIAPAAQAELRDQLAARGMRAVDLPALLAAAGGGSLPGGRWFLDYCHLTGDAIHLLVAGLAEAILEEGGTRSSAETGPSSAVSGGVIAAEVEATARLGAAVHGAHRMLPVTRGTKVVEHWCRRALEASPGVEGAMRDLVEARVAGAPAVLGAAQQRNLDSPYILGFQAGWAWSNLDADVLAAIGKVLERRGRPGGRWIDEILVAHQGLGPDWRELAGSSFLLAAPLARPWEELLELERLPGRAMLRCCWPETGFLCVAPGGRAVEVRATLRCAASCEDPPERVVLAVDGEPLAELDAGPRWTTTSAVVPAERARRGLLRLGLRWPMPGERGEEALERAVRRLERGLDADLFPVFGEIFSLAARLSPDGTGPSGPAPYAAGR